MKVAKRAYTAMLEECSGSDQSINVLCPHTSRSPNPLPASSPPEPRAVTAGMARR